MKRFRNIFLMILSLLSASAFTMRIDQPCMRADVKTFFIPQDQEQMRRELFQVLDRAQRQVLVAVYWITDDEIINKLIQIKQQRGIDVQIIFDESSGNAQQEMKKFLRFKITPFLYPSVGYGKMHNKFVVIDDSITITGSLNFTKTACDPECSVFNFENVIILESPDIAQKYRTNFFEIQKHILEFYVNLIAAGDNTPWFNTLAPVLNNQNPNFKNIAQEILDEIEDRSEKEKIQNFFGFTTKRARNASPTLGQLIVLEHLGIPTEDMSQQNAFEMIETIYKNRRSKMLGRFNPPSETQIKILEKESIPWKDLSYDEAYEIVGKIWKSIKRIK